MKEIGSEFWLTDITKEKYDYNTPTWLNLGNDNRLLLSGRTAIDYVLRDIMKNHKINTVYFPSYCCQSMIQPFENLGIKIIFYDVNYNGTLNFEIDTEQECDVFFAMNYFGFLEGRMDQYIKAFKKRNIIVIEDCTHSLLSEKPYNFQSDYIVASLRKWFPVISGGLAVKRSGRFEIRLKDETLEEMISIRKSAMLEKNQYINGNSNIIKKSFLEKYRIANEMLTHDFSLYDIDKISLQILHCINIESVINIRRDNVRTLYGKLQQNKSFNLMFHELQNGDCPIFVPIIFNNSSERNDLRTHLINKDVYCPVHWPEPSVFNGKSKSNINNKELSIVTDQRYDKTDMQYLLRRLEEFYE